MSENFWDWWIPITFTEAVIASILIYTFGYIMGRLQRK
jgi:hypothetical protein